jgi:hypothetical protein
VTARSVSLIAFIAILAGGAYWVRDRLLFYLISRPSLRTYLVGRKARRKHRDRG